MSDTAEIVIDRPDMDDIYQSVRWHFNQGDPDTAKEVYLSLSRRERDLLIHMLFIDRHYDFITFIDDTYGRILAAALNGKARWMQV